ncbi:peptidoglycan-binding protein [Streptomyces sp. TLI_105]|uniref:peptidoglycan-binding domain-containing protein n=1 Tax=Streptomyces sp. TLI_105 TaxID=1881019 RepID=UPI000B89E18C
MRSPGEHTADEYRSLCALTPLWNGNFGSGTEAAVKTVQKCSGLTADDQVGPKTWKYLAYPMFGCGH